METPQMAKATCQPFKAVNYFGTFLPVFSAFIDVYMYLYIECVCLRACGRVFVCFCGFVYVRVRTEGKTREL